MTTSYVFTAYMAAPDFDELKPGDAFTLASLSQTTVGIFDQDGRLGSLGPRGNVRDQNGQTGAPDGDDAYFISARYLLRNDDGDRYRMIEISEENSEESYFTFAGNAPARHEALTLGAVRGGDGRAVSYDRLGTTDRDPGGSISGRYFCDDDDDAIFGPADPDVAGMSVILVHADGYRVARTTTADDGSFVFEGIEDGRYRVHFASDGPSKEFVSPSRGDNDQTDSDVVDRDFGISDWISIQGGNDVTGINAGIAYIDPVDSFLF